MRINFIEEQLKLNGGRRVVFIYADALKKFGHDVRIISVNPNPFRRMIADIIHYRPAWTKPYDLKIVRVPDLSAIHIPDADITVADFFDVARIISDYPPEKGMPIHFVQHDERLYHGDPALVDQSYKLPIRKIVIADWLREMFEKDYGIKPDLVLNTVDRNMFHPVPRTKPANEIRILILDHTYKWKGTAEGVRIVQNLKKKYPMIRLILFGIRKEQTEFACDEYYYNIPQEKLSWLYSNSDIFLCPSWDEGFTLPSVEAMACRCALATYGTGSARHYAFDEKTALVAERKNEHDLYRQLERLVENQELRLKIANGGYEMVKQWPTWDDQARKMEAIFQDALNQKK